MALFLLPFSIWSYQDEEWRSAIIICMIIFGGLLIIAFILYETYLAPVKFTPTRLLMDRTVFSAGIMLVFVFAQSSIWGSFFSSMLLVVVGLIVHRVGRFKWMGTYYALPLTLLGVGLLIKFRQSSEPLDYVIMCQIFIAFASGPMVIAGEMAMMAPPDHQHVAVIMAVLNLFCSIGSAIGSSISSAIWTGTFRNELIKNLPKDAPIDTIYVDVQTQSSYPVGSDIRNGTSQAYSASQR